MTGPAPASPPVDDRRALFTLLAVVYINMAGFGVIIPLLPFYGSSFHVSPAQVTMMFACFSLGNVFAEPLWGRVSDKIGRRPVLLITIAGNALSYLALAFAPHFWVACAIRVGGGVLSGNISTIQGYIADVTPPEKRAARLGLLGAAFGLGFITGPVIGGLLTKGAVDTAGFRPAFLASMGFCLTAFAGVLLFVRESRVHVHKDATDEVAAPRFAALREARGNPVISRTILVNMIAVAAFAGVEAVFGLWANKRYGWDQTQIAFCFGSVGITAVLVQGFLTGRLARRYGEANVMILGLVIIGVGLVAQPFTTFWPLSVANMVLVALGQSLTFPNVSAMISHATSPDRQGAMLGLNLSGGALARIIGPLAAGPLFQMVGVSAPFMAGAILMIPAVITAWRAAAAVRKLRHG